MTAQPDETNEPTEEPTEAPEEHVQPNEHPDAPDSGSVVELHTERGSLTLRPNQTTLDPEQKAALLAIGIDLASDPAVVPHLRAFMHMCQVKGLDPFAREAYLIGRGQGTNRKWTMQTGIDGYRKMAATTGRFIRVADVLWTGADDDDRSYYRDERGVMRRVWYDQWPASRGYPGAAKVVIEHYDDTGVVVQTEAVADWSMYAPFQADWEWHPTQRGKKVYKTNPDGTPAQTLNDMWSKGYAHMLAKCAEALAYRKAFPSRMSGIYTHEEMHRLDQQEQEHAAIQQRAARQQAYLAATGGPSAPMPTSDPAPVAEDVAEAMETLADPDGTPHSEPSVPVTPTEDPADAEQRAEWLRAELAYQAGVLGHAESKLAARQMRALRKNIEDMTDAELLPVVVGLRGAVVARLREDDASEAEVDAYDALAPTDVVNLAEYLTVVADDDEPDEGFEPGEPHEYQDAGGICAVCDDFEDTPLHPAK